ncbi:hypothetical protein [Bradyrhizobium sp. AZCC 2289]|uniref:hypothetical protein n=1 Tax=Bradyrhizobium sp. AZCC 2289 TaxID=3117026 RepID=UPI002FEF1FCD
MSFRDYISTHQTATASREEDAILAAVDDRGHMTALPQWTEPAEKRGLDPLGIQNSGVVLYQALLPGISNVTLRIRYYGFYCWLSDAYAHHEGSTNLEDWRRWVRRGEALYALVSSAAGGEGGVGGIDWANSRLSLKETEIDFAEASSTDAKVSRYLRQSMGVFGGAYYSQMVETGLFERGSHGIPKATIGAGLKSANAFREAVGPDVEDLLIAKIQSARVTSDELIALRALTPSNISDTSSERESYEQILFPVGDGAKDQSRRATLLLLLRVSAALSKRPDPDDIRWYLFKNADTGYSDPLERQRLRWETYQVHDLFQVAAAGLLSWSIALMAELDGGLEFGQISALATDRLEGADPSSSRGSWKNFSDSLSSKDDDFQAWSQSVAGRRHAPDKIWDVIKLIAALYDRVNKRRDLAAEVDRSFPIHAHSRSVRTELIWFREREDQPLVEVIADYLMQRVVRRHTWVAMQKLRRQKDYTFLFEVHDGRLSRRADYLPVQTTPRLAPAVQFLADIKLLAADGLTARGRRLLEGVL